MTSLASFNEIGASVGFRWQRPLRRKRLMGGANVFGYFNLKSSFGPASTLILTLV